MVNEGSRSIGDIRSREYVRFSGRGRSRQRMWNIGWIKIIDVEMMVVIEDPCNNTNKGNH